MRSTSKWRTRPSSSWACTSNVLGATTIRSKNRSQDDYYSFSAFFSRLARKPLADAPNLKVREKRLYHNEGIAEAANPRTGKTLRPTALGGKPLSIPADHDPRVQLADWMARPDNPFFAVSRQPLLEAFLQPWNRRTRGRHAADESALESRVARCTAQHFIASGFDLKDLVRTICTSSTYQLSSLPNDQNLKDRQNFSRYYPKRLSAEVLYDTFHRVTATSQAYSGLPAGTQAMQLPDPSEGTYFLKVFGQPQGDTACECERSQEGQFGPESAFAQQQRGPGQDFQPRGPGRNAGCR